ncbi:transcriptional regulator [Marinobacterium zhoushanense]|uniref:Transcriptional regulator n=1 Tax=Marinobacterium zhoushanense TaxID=1679163 RepID=A0ABQ1KY37_9GAMM|nr:helix-turn-helix domain-containing protein [Marinobacterium zhoushanense]GGC12138.1 transcriptional regulator [Marinobacterium zhoushanense]
MDNFSATVSGADWVSTHDIPSVERRSYWLNHVNKRVIQVDCPAEVKEGIDASLRHLDLECMRLNQIRANTHSIQRSLANIAHDDRHSVFLCFMLSGEGFSYQGTQCVQHSPGDIILYDTLMPYGQGFPEDMEMVVMDLPEPLAKQYLRDWQRGDLLHLHRDTRFADTSCETLFRLLNAITDQRASANQQSTHASDLLENIEALISNICSGNRDQDFWRQCRRYIQQHLQEDSLTTARLARELNTSTRKLHRTFAENGLSVQNYIWQQRLEQCRKDILAPSLANRSVSEIAFKWGFNDASHFSRRYKAHYGESPVETRKALR